MIADLIVPQLPHVLPLNPFYLSYRIVFHYVCWVVVSAHSLSGPAHFALTQLFVPPEIFKGVIFVLSV